MWKWSVAYAQDEGEESELSDNCGWDSDRPCHRANFVSMCGKRPRLADTSVKKSILTEENNADQQVLV